MTEVWETGPRSAFEKRYVKGLASDYLRGLGFETYASDSSAPIVLVTTDKAGLQRLDSLFVRVSYRRGIAGITFGKVNTRRLAGLLHTEA